MSACYCLQYSKLTYPMLWQKHHGATAAESLVGPHRIPSWFPPIKLRPSRSPAYLSETLGDTSVSGCQHYGGAPQYKNVWDISEIQPYIVGTLDGCWLKRKHICYHSHCHISHARSHPDMLHVAMPLKVLVQKLRCNDIKDLYQAHNLAKLKGGKLEVLRERLVNAQCCDHITVFVPLDEHAIKKTPIPLSLTHHHELC